MSEKKAFVFDTNFIIKNNKLDEVIKNLDDSFVVYVTQISIDERIAQECRKIKEKYDNLEKLSKEYDGIAKIEQIQSFADKKAFYESGMQHHYEATFGANIIGISKDASTFSKLLERANYKIPPFANADNSSDKGFKDSLIWISIINFFKSNGENSVVFVTDDKGFISRADVLCEEFKNETGKEIEIKECSYYHEILKPSLIEQNEVKKAISFDLSSMRDRIEVVVGNLIQVKIENDWGDYHFNKIFSVNKKIDSDYVMHICDNIDDFLNKNIFEKNVAASSLFDFDNRVTDKDYLLAIDDVESFNSLYCDIKKQCPEYLEQFYTTVANMINRNYVEEVDIDEILSGELPF